MSLDTKLKTLVDPTIKLEELSIADTESTDTNNEVERRDIAIKKSNIVGDLYPFIKIESYPFTHRDIIYLEINETKIIPTLSLTLIDNTGVFGSAYFPKKKSIVSVYIRSKKKEYKPIRNDYLITRMTPSTSGIKSEAAESKGTTYFIEGILFIPDLYNEKLEVQKNKSSLESLQSIAKELELGFVTNEETTDDVMNWLSCGYSNKNFIEFITRHSFKDRDSFFISFIDKYYHLNFINVNKMLSDELEFDKMLTSITTYCDYLKQDEDFDQTTDSIDLILSNSSLLLGSDIYINEFSLISNQGTILLKKGFRQIVSYYDHSLVVDNIKDKPINLYVEPIGTKNKRNKNELLLPDNEKLRNCTSTIWTGIDYGNTHDMFMFAKILNNHNINELNKINITAELDNINLGITRGMRIPIMIIREGSTVPIGYNALVDDDTPEETKDFEENVNLKFDRYLSDFYFVKGIKYIFNPNRAKEERHWFYTELSLAKREWKKTPEIELEK